MKTSQTILSSLTGQANFQSLKRHKCYRLFVNMLPPRFQEAIGFVYVKNNTLHVALRHPGYKMELNYNKELLISLLSTLTKNKTECQALSASKVVIFNSKYAVPFRQSSDSETVPYYHELSEGSFEDNSKDTRLGAQFEKIRTTILKYRKS